MGTDENNIEDSSQDLPKPENQSFIIKDDGTIEFLEHVEEKSDEDDLKMEVEGLRQQNDQLMEAHSAAMDDNQRLREENERLKKENQELKERFLKVRDFITRRCARIPFVGKRIVREMQEQLGEKELPEGREDEEGSR